MASDPNDERKRKVCMVTYQESPTELPPMFNEGVSLASAGFDVESLCLGSEERQPDEQHAPGFRTRRFPVRTRSFFHKVLGEATSNRAVAAVQYVLSYGEYVTRAFVGAVESGADMYEAHDLPALLPAVMAAKVRRRPILYRAHELWSETHAKVRFAPFWKLMDRSLVPLCDDVVTPDENRSRIYDQEFHAKRPPLTVRNCPPYRAPLQSNRLQEELARRKVAFSTIVLYQGLIDSMRCIEEIAEATRYFDDGVVLAILGSGYGKWKDAESRLAGYDRIVVLPRVPYDEVASFTASADIGVLLYRNDCRNNYYCAPNKVFEYMMMGLPVIATNFPGMVKLVEGERVGVCVDPEDPKAIADGINRLARDPAYRSEIKATAIRLSRERYNWEEEWRPLLARVESLSAS